MRCVKDGPAIMGSAFIIRSIERGGILGWVCRFSCRDVAGDVAGNVAGDMAVFLPFLPRFSFCVGRRLEDDGNIGTLGVPAERSSVVLWPKSGRKCDRRCGRAVVRALCCRDFKS